MADVACLMPDVKRLDGRTVEYVNGDYAVMFEAIMALVTLAYSANL
jgi:D-aminopeptidase